MKKVIWFTGLSSDLNFSEISRSENIRRIAEI